MATVTVEVNGRPYAALVCAGIDGSNAAMQNAEHARRKSTARGQFSQGK